MNSSVSVRLPEELILMLEEISKETERPKSFHIQKAIEQYLLERADLQIALDRLQDFSDKVISTKEIRNKLGL
ncbi:MAG: ribbon-helix-helix domain-containing protein [Ignavibacteria bacterium]|nr:ribbon-helix-helix domain-containing protein [Ignavibacteria bacterium]